MPIRIPVQGAQNVSIRYSPLPRTGEFDPGAWPISPLQDMGDGWYQIDLATLRQADGNPLADGSYEYEFVVQRSGQQVPDIIPDPYAEEITRFGGYRGIFYIRQGNRIRLPFSWNNELPPGVQLPNNNQMVIYELPMRWISTSPEGYERQVGLGTFDKAIFERFEYFKDLGVNAIELLPIQDSPDTLNWGYGTRFFFAPDLDMGEPFDLKLFIKRCHQNSIRVILDVVMNHSRGCPLEQLAFDWFYLRSGAEEPINSSEERPSWGGQIFRYATRRGGQFQARNFHLDMAQYWIEEYHIDGFRIDEFLGINNWDFIRDFTKHAQSVQQRTFPGRPFIVIAEDSWRRPQSTQPGAANIPVVNAIWDFDFRDELRRLVCNQMYTDLGKPSRTERVKAMLIGNKLWSDWDKNWRNGSFSDLAQRVTYCTSHDIEKDEEQRLYSFFLSKLEHVGHSISDAETHSIAFEQVCSAFALMLTTAGMPMFLAGEEFAELHDTDRRNWRLKMSDPIDWTRSEQPGRRDLIRRIKELVKLRTTHPALQRNEIELFSMNNGFHPSFDTNDGERVFVYCRTSGQALGRPGQVIVVANCGFKRYPVFDITYWPWGNNPALTEYGGRAQPLPAFNGQLAQLELMPFQVRVFSV